jgi:hypothetical protein
MPEPTPGVVLSPEHQMFYDLAQTGVIAGIAVSCLLAVVLGMAFVRAVW